MDLAKVSKDIAEAKQNVVAAESKEERLLHLQLVVELERQKTELLKQAVAGALTARTVKGIKAVLKAGRKEVKASIRAPSSLQHLCDVAEAAWPELAKADYNITQAGVVLTNDEALQTCIEDLPVDEQGWVSGMFQFESLCKGFSDFSLEEARKYLGISAIVQDDSKFKAAELQGKEVDDLIEHVMKDLTLRVPVFGPIHEGAEYTNREFYSPILLAASVIVKDVQLRAEYKVLGSCGAGPVDYVALYSDYPILVSEVKHARIEEALPQNLAQLAASKEQFVSEHPGLSAAPTPSTSAPTTSAPTPSCRKRKAYEMSEVARVPSSAIITTAEKYIFLRYEIHPQVCVYKSDEYHVGFQTRTPELLRQQVRAVLERVVGLFQLQKQAIDDDDGMKRLRQRR